jgi:hypothetical protein
MLAPAGSAAAQAASDGISWECTTEVKFLLPGPYGALPVFKSPLDRKRPHRRWDPAVQGPETIEATAVVGADGAIRELRMYWMQSGLMGWPQTGRADLDDVALYVSFGQSESLGGLTRLAGPHAKFDPALLSVEVRAQETRKMKRPRLLVLRRSIGDKEHLGGLADIPPWLQSASIYLGWDELQRFTGSLPRLLFSIEEIVFRDGRFHHDHVRGGDLHLSVMPEVIARFREAEARLHEKAKQPKSQCRELPASDYEVHGDM